MHSPTQPKTQAEYFRAGAVECLAKSLRVPDPEYQRLYCELAVQWLVLAHEAQDCERAAAEAALKAKRAETRRSGSKGSLVE
jgi:hypothetical protein